MHLNRSPWWFIVLILFLCRIAECDDEKIKRAIYSYQPFSSSKEHGKSNIDLFEKFQGASPFEQVLAALGLSGNSHSNIHTTVEYWPPDMDREKFYQMNQRGEFFPFVSWNYEPNSSLKKTTLLLEQEKQPIIKTKALKKIPEKFYNSQEVHSFSPTYPTYVEQKNIVTTKQPEFKWIEKPSKAPKIKSIVEKAVPVEFPEILKQVPKYFNSKYHKTPSYEINEEIPIVEEIPSFKIIEKIPKIIPRVKNTSKIVEFHRTPTTTSTVKPKVTHPKFYIHTSKLPAQPELKPSSLPSQVDIISSTTEDTYVNDASMTDAGPVVFPQSTTTTRYDIQRGINIKEIFVPHKQKQQLYHRQHHEHEHVLEVKNQDLPSQPPRVNKRRKLKKKVKTSSIAQEVVNIGNRGSSGTQPPPPSNTNLIVTSTIEPQKSTDTAAVVVGSSVEFVDPKYSDMIDNLSKLTELSFNLNSHYNTGGDDYLNTNTESLSTTSKESPTTESYRYIDKLSKNSSVHDENMIVVLNMMRNVSSNISSSNVEELKKAVIDNDLPKVKRIIKLHMEKKPVITTTEVSVVTRGKISRSRFGIKAKTNVTTEKLLSDSTFSSTTKPKIRKPVSTTTKLATTKSSRTNNRTRPSTTPRATTSLSRSTKSIARRITTRKSINKSTTLSS